MNTFENFYDAFKLDKDKCTNLGSHFAVRFLSKCSTEELERYRSRLIDSNFENLMKDEDLVKCVNVFFENDLNIAESARNTFMHRNTFLKRVERIIELTGIDIRKFENAMCFKFLMIVYNLTN